tara:strand:+ start:1390 stop:1542 length:153 start_codon:yes stop_codon:yes gene_type:complete
MVRGSDESNNHHQCQKCSVSEFHSLKTGLMHDILTGKIKVTVNKEEAAFQ